MWETCVCQPPPRLANTLGCFEYATILREIKRLSATLCSSQDLLETEVGNGIKLEAQNSYWPLHTGRLFHIND